MADIKASSRGKEVRARHKRHSFATMIILDKATNIHLLARHMVTSTAMADKIYSHVQSKNIAEKLVFKTGFDEYHSSKDVVLFTLKEINKKKNGNSPPIT